jgi:hypothetical protein
VYDITNVLEGIGLIDKQSKNYIVWRGGALAGAADGGAGLAAPPPPAGGDGEEAELAATVASLQADADALDAVGAKLQAALAALAASPAARARLYVTSDDVASLPSLAGDTVFAVTAPQGTALVVPDPGADGARGGAPRYRAHLTAAPASCPGDPGIEVWLVSGPAAGGGPAAPPPPSPGGAAPPSPGGDAARAWMAADASPALGVADLFGDDVVAM